MARHGENIYKRKDGRWEGRFVTGRIGGRTSFGYVYGRTYAETKAKRAAACSAWIAHNDDVMLTKRKLRAVGNDWLMAAKPLLKESTLIKYADYLRWYIFPEFGHMDMGEITNPDVYKFRQKMLGSGGVKGMGLSTKIVSEVLRIIRRLGEHALNSGIAVGFAPDFDALKQRKKPMRILNVQEQEKLCAYLEKYRSITNIGILLCLATGIRLGEVCALKWDDISLDKKELCVHKTLYRISTNGGDNEAKTKIIITTPKSISSIRVIPLPEKLCQTMAPLYKRGWYFLGEKKGKFMEPRTMQNRFESTIRVCGLEEVNFHALRHTFATRCIEAGFDVKCLSEILGHSSVATTLNRYVHPSMDLKHKCMAKLSCYKL